MIKKPAVLVRLPGKLMDRNANQQLIRTGMSADVASIDGMIMTLLGPTQLIQFGLPGPITDSNFNMFNDVSKIIFVIPGNPGSIEFYRYFMAQLHLETSLPVVGLSHPGHIRHRIDLLKGPPTVRKLIDHKLEFVEKFIPDHVEIVLVGHSLGTYISTQMMLLAENRDRFHHSFLMMPVLERFTETPGWRNIQIPLFFRPILAFFALIMSLFREDLVYRMIPYFVSDLSKRTPTCVYSGIIQLIDRHVVSNIFQLTLDEAAQIQDRDDSFLERHLDKLTIMYCPNDDWSPLKFYRNLKNRFPNGDIVMIDTVTHAFVMDTTMTRDIVNEIASKINNGLSN